MLKPKKTKKTILVVEDNAAMNYILTRELSKRYKVVQVSDGMNAIQELKNGFMPDVIVSDIRMPLVNGLELIHILKTSGLYKHIPIVVVSAMNESDCKEACLKAGASKFIIKPFDPKNLHEVIDGLMNNDELPQAKLVRN